MIKRKIGKIVRGKASRCQVASAAVLGATLAFLPAFDQAAGLYVLLLGTLLVLNGNLGVAALVALPAKLVAPAAAPLSFAIGRALLDGPVSGLFRWLINAPITAYFGLEYYVTTGGLVLGVAFGATTGWMLVTVLAYLRDTFADVERDSEHFWELTEERWVRVTSFVFLGGHGQKTYEDLLRKREELPVRPSGLVLIGVCLTLALFFQSFLGSTFLANAMRSTLERTNGATVDITGLRLELGRGRLTIDGLALADRDDLHRDVFRAEALEAEISTTDLLRKRLTIDRLRVAGATCGEPRAVRGKPAGHGVGRPARRAPPTLALGSFSLEEVFQHGADWRERLANTQRWVERLAPDPAARRDEDEQSRRERLERHAREIGYSELRASHLIQHQPRFLISDLLVENLAIVSFEDETFEVRARNLTTQPHLVTHGSRVEIASHSESITAVLTGDQVRLEVRGLPVERVSGSLQVAGERPVAGGTLDLFLAAGWSHGRAGDLDASLHVTLHGSLLTIPGLGSTVVDHFELPLALAGPLGDLLIRVDDEELASALVDAGQAWLAERVRARAQAELDALELQLREEAAADPGAGELGEAEPDQAPENEAGGLLGGFLERR